MLLEVKKVVSRTWISFSIIWLILDRREIVIEESRSSLLNVESKFAVLKPEGKFPVEKVIQDIVSLTKVWNNFRTLVEILEGSVDLLFFRFFISGSTSSVFTKYDYKLGFLK